MKVEIIKKFALSEAVLKCNAPQTSNDYSASNLERSDPPTSGEVSSSGREIIFK
jgi:hypothetical protein